MMILVCDECGVRDAQTIQLMEGYAVQDGVVLDKTHELKSTQVDLCDDHWPEEGAMQPKNCKTIKFVWSEGRKEAGEPLYSGPVPPHIHGRWYQEIIKAAGTGGKDNDENI